MLNFTIIFLPIHISFCFNANYLIDFTPTVPGDPQKVSVISVNSTAIRVEWKPPAEKEQYGIIRGYQIHVQEVDAKVC